MALQLGMITPDARVVTGSQIVAISQSELETHMTEFSVYARVDPEHKLRIVQAWQKHGDIVAMTGDGINDASAIKVADIGIAMGKAGTDVTKQAAAMILTDDRFDVIVHAVEEGRGIYENIRNIVHFLVAGNTSEILLVVVAALMGWPPPLLPIPILWINLVTDGLPALALATEGPSSSVMQRPPIPPDQPIFTLAQDLKIMLQGGLLGGVTLAGYYWVLYVDPQTRGQLAEAQAVAFTVSALSQLLFALTCRHDRKTLAELGFCSNRYLFMAVIFSIGLQISLVLYDTLQPIFFLDIPHFDATLWLVTCGLSLLPVTGIEILKVWTGRDRLSKDFSKPSPSNQMRVSP